MKILCYSAKLVAGLNVDKNPDLAKRFAIISSKISGARATLRLIDDIPMLQYTLEYGLGSKVRRQSKGVEKKQTHTLACYEPYTTNNNPVYAVKFIYSSNLIDNFFSLSFISPPLSLSLFLTYVRARICRKLIRHYQ